MKTKLLYIFIGLGAQPLLGNDIFMHQGPWVRASGGAYQTESRTAATVLHNPSRLSNAKSHGYVDLGLGNFQYKFKPMDEDYQEGAIKIPALPLISTGFSYRPFTKWTVGAVFIPLGLPGRQEKVDDFPITTGGDLSNADLTLEQTSYKLATGLSYRFSKALKLGIGVTQHTNATKTTISDPETGEEVMALTLNSKDLSPTLGLSGAMGKLRWGFSHTRPTYEKYTITASESGNPDETAKGQSYRAATYSAGASYRFNRIIKGFGQYTLERWAPGSDSSTMPVTKITLGSLGTDFKDTDNMVLGAKFILPRQRSIYVSYAQFGANKGYGWYNEEGETIYEGVGLRDFEAMNRQHFTAGYAGKFQGQRLASYLSYINASATAPSGTPSEGDYNLRLILLGSGIVFD